jgi:hypothetical protein
MSWTTHRGGFHQTVLQERKLVNLRDDNAGPDPRAELYGGKLRARAMHVSVQFIWVDVKLRTNAIIPGTIMFCAMM